MQYKFNFIVDRLIKSQAYPALAQHAAEPYTLSWRQFVQHWPYTVPVELFNHCQTHRHEFCYVTDYDHLPDNGFYAIGLGFFDFSIDYISLVPESILNHIRQKQIRILFYYHEGDNPFRIKEQLDMLCKKNNIDKTCYVFVSGNTAAGKQQRFYWFPDHELLYWHRNKDQPPLKIHNNPRSKDFTVLNRSHKMWRATIMSELLSKNILDNSYWSYGNIGTDANENNPLEIDSILDLQKITSDFLSHAPYLCDTLTGDEQNDHSQLVEEHFTNSYIHVVLETHFDADQSGGTFLTEKTFKVLKHGQPFVIIGPAHSLLALKQLGYKTFDNIIDPSYDQEIDNQQRWRCVINLITKLKSQNLKELFELCRDDIEHNQRLFASSKWNRVNNLWKQLHE